MSRMSRFRTCAISCAMTPCSSSRESVFSSPSVTAMLAVAGIPAGREGVGVVVGDDPDPGPRLPRRDRHLLDHVDELPLLRRGRLGDLPGAGDPEHPLRAEAPGVPADAGRREGGEDADDGNDVVVGSAWRVGGQEAEREIAAEPDPGEEDDEPDDEPGRAAAVGLLLCEEIGLFAHGAGLFERQIDRGHRALGGLLDLPELGRRGLGDAGDEHGGKLAWAVLYCVAVSL